MKKPFRFIAMTASTLALLDQLVKLVASKNFIEPFVLIDDIFEFSYSTNVGIAFGIPVPYFALVIINLILILFIVYWAKKELNLKKIVSLVAVSLILGGGVSNLIDRVLNGYVIDFISIWKYPTFNLADVYITVGILLLVVFYGKINRRK